MHLYSKFAAIISPIHNSFIHCLEFSSFMPSRLRSLFIAMYNFLRIKKGVIFIFDNTFLKIYLLYLFFYSFYVIYTLFLYLHNLDYLRFTFNLNLYIQINYRISHLHLQHRNIFGCCLHYISKLLYLYRIPLSSLLVGIRLYLQVIIYSFDPIFF